MLRLLLVMIAVLCFANVPTYGRGQSRSQTAHRIRTSGSKTVKVREYKRKNGTTVKPHKRRAPRA
jgi:hypothetical protein